VSREDQDFLTVDDGDFFTYYPSAAALCADFEYAGETESITDRRANNYHLVLDENERITLGPSRGKADLLWLRRAWQRIQKEHPYQYPLNRKLPETDDAFLDALFQSVQLTSGDRPAGKLWAVSLGGHLTHLPNLAEVTAMLLNLPDLSGVVVDDPYAHSYDPARVDRGGLIFRGRHYILYTER
jgi:hypothetical protein